jgi:hypothetical protein
MSDPDPIHEWIECLNRNAERLKSGDFDVDRFKQEGGPIVLELVDLRDPDGGIRMSREASREWVDANTGFAGAAQQAMNVLGMVAYAEFIEELTGKKILPEPGETKPPEESQEP